MVVVDVVVVAVVVVWVRCRGGQPKSEVKKLEGVGGRALLLLLLLWLLWLLWVDGCC